MLRSSLPHEFNLADMNFDVVCNSVCVTVYVTVPLQTGTGCTFAFIMLHYEGNFVIF